MTETQNDFFNGRVGGCWLPIEIPSTAHPVQRRYLPPIQFSSSTTILETTSRTVLRQTFANIQDRHIDQVHYAFPLHDGVSVVEFSYTVGSKTVRGIVKEKRQARLEYQEATGRGETAGLLEQLPLASDVFTASIGDVPAKETIHVTLVYLSELKHDAQADGSRFTIPTRICPRYGSFSLDVDTDPNLGGVEEGRFSISVDVTLDRGSAVSALQSPSHSIEVTIGRTSTMNEGAFSVNNASATLSHGTIGLEKDFVLLILRKDPGIPCALLESHPSIPHRRALMATVVPKFNIPNTSPEIVFVVDRSGSMQDKIGLVVEAMKILLKSLPVGVKFNICSFGSHHSFMFDKSRTYDQSSLRAALKHVDSFAANYGGTQLLKPIKETVDSRFSDLPLEVIVLTDGQVWNQEELFACVNETENARFFTLGIGSGASSSLVEGIARAGNGFAQFVQDGEKMERKLVRMLKGALTPHVSDYTLQVTYEAEEPAVGVTADDFELVEAVKETTVSDLSKKDAAEEPVGSDLNKPSEQKTISLFDPNATEEPPNPPAGLYDSLPAISAPEVLQAPYKIGALVPFHRTTIYLLLGPDAPPRTPKSVLLRGTSEHGVLELEIPVQDVGIGQTIHQLAAKKAIQELEEGRGWLNEARAEGGQLLKSLYEGKWDLIVEREAVKLGTMFQVAGKWCSFVAVESNDDDNDAKESCEPEPGTVCAERKSNDSHKHEHTSQAKSGGDGGANMPSAGFITNPTNIVQPHPPRISELFANCVLKPDGRYVAANSTLAQPAPAPTGRRIPSFLCRRVPGPASAEPTDSDSHSDADSNVDADADAEPEGDHKVDSKRDHNLDLSCLPTSAKLHKLIDLQEFDGPWHLADHLLQLLNLTEEKALSLNVDLQRTREGEGDGDVNDTSSQSTSQTIKATALAIAWLETNASPETWDLVVEKALGWLRAQFRNDNDKGGLDFDVEAVINKLIDHARNICPLEPPDGML